MTTLDPRRATRADLARLAREVNGLADTAYSLRASFPILEPAGAFVPGNAPGTPYGRVVRALVARGLAAPDPSGVWPVHLTVLGLIVREELNKEALQRARATVEAWRALESVRVAEGARKLISLMHTNLSNDEMPVWQALAGAG